MSIDYNSYSRLPDSLAYPSPVPSPATSVTKSTLSFYENTTSSTASTASSSSIVAAATYGNRHSVYVRSLHKAYGKSKILKGLDMTVPVGNIYGLLGPSGCGKSTFLKILLGRLSAESGTVEVLGQIPGTPGHSVPGHAVGYMPQEIALYQEFTIGETLGFYARLHGMTSEQLNQRKKFLLDFLDLPTEHRMVKNLSGGQQRRVSLAVALLHNPKLLILDEPTVGVDPLLRAKIWNYLVEISRSGVSIIITTHYTDEARQANTVGMMRDGKILAEGKPDDLLRELNKESLEDVFLHLCQKEPDQEERELLEKANKKNVPREDAKQGLLQSVNAAESSEEEEKLPPAIQPPQQFCGGPPTKNITFSLIWKNYKRMSRNWGFLLFSFLLPALQVVLFCVAIGRDPEDLKLALVNLDKGTQINATTTSYFSNHFLSFLDPTVIQLNQYDTVDSGLSAVKSGKAWGVIYMGPYFSEDLKLRFLPSASVTDQVLTNSTIFLNLDMTNQQIFLIIESRISEAFTNFMESQLEILKAFGLPVNPNSAKLPVELVDPPIYGSAHPRYTDFIAPGMIINIAFAQAIGLTALAFVVDKREGTMDRAWSSGVRPSEVLASHVITQFFVLLVQVGLLLFVALYIFALPLVGNIGLVLLLTMLLGMAGMLYGLWISSICEREQEAIQMSLGSFFPILLLSGVIWPLDAEPTGLKYISLGLPTTWAATAMRKILSCGWGLGQSDVLTGFLVVIGWSLLFLYLASRGLKSRD